MVSDRAFKITFHCQANSREGPYIFLWMLHTPYLIVNSGKVASDLLESRAALYSDRPYSIMATELSVVANLF